MFLIQNSRSVVVGALRPIRQMFSAREENSLRNSRYYPHRTYHSDVASRTGKGFVQASLLELVAELETAGEEITFLQYVSCAS